MATISQRDVATLLELVHDGAAAPDEEAFPTEVLRALAELIPSDACVGYQEADVSNGFRVVELIEVIGEPLSPEAEAALDTLGLENPMHCRVHASTHHALRLSDLLTRRQRRRLAWDALVWRVHGIDDALRVWLPAAPGRSRSVYLERSGKTYTDRELMLFSLLRPNLVRMHVDSDARRPSRPTTSLTTREAEVLDWIAEGKTNAEIGRLLFISPHTVRKHIENIFEKLDVRTRTAAARYAGANRDVPRRQSSVVD